MASLPPPDASDSTAITLLDSTTTVSSSDESGSGTLEAGNPVKKSWGRRALSTLLLPEDEDGGRWYSWGCG